MARSQEGTAAKKSRWFRLTNRRLVLTPVLATMIVAIALVVSSCWMPNQFISEIRISTDRSYGFIYKGELMWVPLARDIRDGKLSQQEIAEKIAVLYRDLDRDPNFKSIRSMGDGRFLVHYEKEGRLNERGMFIFLRRTDRLVVVETFEDGTARVYAKPLRPEQRKQIGESGLSIGGKLRVVTNARATGFNAQSVKPRGVPGYVIYDWEITGPESETPIINLDLNLNAIMPRN